MTERQKQKYPGKALKKHIAIVDKEAVLETARQFIQEAIDTRGLHSVVLITWLNI